MASDNCHRLVASPPEDAREPPHEPYLLGEGAVPAGVGGWPGQVRQHVLGSGGLRRRDGVAAAAGLLGRQPVTAAAVAGAGEHHGGAGAGAQPRAGRGVLLRGHRAGAVLEAPGPLPIPTGRGRTPLAWQPQSRAGAATSWQQMAKPIRGHNCIAEAGEGGGHLRRGATSAVGKLQVTAHSCNPSSSRGLALIGSPLTSSKQDLVALGVGGRTASTGAAAPRTGHLGMG